MQWAAGSPFTLPDRLAAHLSDALDVQVPGAPFVALDYTLDWLCAAVTCFTEPAAWTQPQPLVPGAVTGSQEDVDLLIAWEDDAPHVVLIEAKGFTGWSNKQMASKASRLDAIFTDAVRRTVDVHFVLAGPKPSAGLNTSGWPAWMTGENRVRFVEIPNPGSRWAVQRTGPASAAGEAANTWTMWRAVPRVWG